MVLYMVVSVILALVLIGILFIIALSIMNLVFCIIGAVRANNGEIYTYPLAIPFIGK